MWDRDQVFGRPSIRNGFAELSLDVTEELTACMIAKAQHDTPRGNLSKESYRTMRVHLPLKGLVAYLVTW